MMICVAHEQYTHGIREMYLKSRISHLYMLQFPLGMDEKLNGHSNLSFMNFR